MTDEVVRGEIEDRPLTEWEKEGLRTGKSKGPANGTRSFKDHPPETLREFQRRSRKMIQARKEAARLAELTAFMQAHKELAHVLLGGKMAVLGGLLDEMRVIDEHGVESYDTRLLDDKRLKVLLQIIDMVEKRGFGSHVQKQETKVDVDVTHRLADLAKKLGG